MLAMALFTIGIIIYVNVTVELRQPLKSAM